MAEGHERRKYPRIEVNAYVDYTGSDVLLFHRIENISLGGICIQAPALEEVGSTVELVVNFPDLEESIATQGEVTWIRDEEPRQMGIRYVGMTEEQLVLLQRYLDAANK